MPSKEKIIKCVRCGTSNSNVWDEDKYICGECLIKDRNTLRGINELLIDQIAIRNKATTEAIEKLHEVDSKALKGIKEILDQVMGRKKGGT